MQLKNKLASGLGSALEWYDFALYGYFADIFARQFFPHNTHHSIALIASFSVFAIGFAARPLGGILFGIYGDKYGRIKCLRLTPILITVPSILIALIPTYSSIGITAPLLLLLLRIMQGICIGGEFAGNIIYLCESDLKRRYFIGSIASVTAGLGILLASLVASIIYHVMSVDAIALWGWRMAFLLSIIVGSVAFYIRRRLAETPVYEILQKINKTSPSPFWEAISHDKKKTALAIGLLFLHANSFYFTFMFLPSFLTNKLGLTAEASLFHNNFLLLINLTLSPLIGLIADRIGGQRLMLFSSLCYLILSVYLFHLICYGHAPYTYIAILLFSLLTTLNAGTAPGLLIEILPAPTRYTTLATAFNISFGIFGGSMPLLGYLLIQKMGHIMAPAFYLMISAAITFIATILLKRYQLTSNSI